MGLMDGFTSDGTVEMKHTEYYNLMREAAKAELITNAIKADVPSWYINAMITGKMVEPTFNEILEAEENESQEEWGTITTAVKNILEAWDNESQVRDMAESIHAVIVTLTDARVKELRMKQYATWATENERKCPESWSCRTCGHTNPESQDPEVCRACEDGSNYTMADAENAQAAAGQPESEGVAE